MIFFLCKSDRLWLLTIKPVAYVACYNLLNYYTFTYSDLRIWISEHVKIIFWIKRKIIIKKKNLPSEYRYRYSTIVTVLDVSPLKLACDTF